MFVVGKKGMPEEGKGEKKKRKGGGGGERHGFLRPCTFG